MNLRSKILTYSTAALLIGGVGTAAAQQHYQPKAAQEQQMPKPRVEIYKFEVKGPEKEKLDAIIGDLDKIVDQYAPKFEELRKEHHQEMQKYWKEHREEFRTQMRENRKEMMELQNRLYDQILPKLDELKTLEGLEFYKSFDFGMKDQRWKRMKPEEFRKRFDNEKFKKRMNRFHEDLDRRLQRFHQGFRIEKKGDNYIIIIPSWEE